VAFHAANRGFIAMQITLPDGSIKSYDRPVSALDVAREIGPKLAEAAIGAKVNDQLYDLNRPLPGDCRLAIITKPRTDKEGKTKGEHNPDALYLLRHSTAHVMAEAIQRLFPKALLAYGPPLDNGFYYDIALDTPISTEDFPKIEAEMAKIVAENRAFTRYELPPADGMTRLNTEGNKYKVDNARRAIDGGAATLSWYVTGQKDQNWEDLCMGPHVPIALARRRHLRPLPARVRHGVLLQGGPRRAARTARRGQAARPPRHRPEAGPLRHR